MKKYIGGQYIEMTAEEISQALQTQQPTPEPTETQRIEALESAVLEMAEVIYGG